MTYMAVAQASSTKEAKRSKLKRAGVSLLPRRLFGGVFLPFAIGALLVVVHLAGLSLLNWESAQRERLRAQITQLRQENEALRAQLNRHTNEWSIRMWAEEAGMVRVEDKEAIVVAGRATAPSEAAWGRSVAQSRL